METARTVIGDRDLKTIPSEPPPDGKANVQIVVDYKNSSHNGFSRRTYAFNQPRILIAL